MTNKEISGIFGNEYILHFSDLEWGGAVMVMQREGKAFVRFYSYDDQNCMYLASLSVHAEYRNNGQATRIMQLAERVAKENGFGSIVLKADEGSWMYEWYKRLGYVQFGDMEDDGLTWMKKSFAIVDTKCRVTQTIH